MRTLLVRVRAELQADQAHEDPRPSGQGRLPVSLLRDALLRAVHTREAHAQVRGEPEQQVRSHTALHHEDGRGDEDAHEDGLGGPHAADGRRHGESRRL